MGADAAGAGRRALVNAAFDLLAHGEPAVLPEIAARLHAATNMTDRIAALAVLVHRGAADAEAALAAFHARFREAPLAIDKWLSVQASAPRPDALDRVVALTRHASFSMRNPNRVRALIGAFATLNPTQFARADGAGFDFVADTVLEIDRFNPQLAARLLTGFRSWRTFEPGRRARAEAALGGIQRRGDLSINVRDIIDRTLA